MGERYYPVQTSKAPLYIYAALIASPMIAAIALVGFSEFIPAALMCITVLILLLIYASGFRIRYEVDDKEIRFRQGLFATWRIEIKGITRVLPAHGPAGISVRNIDCLLIEAGRQRRLVAAPDLDVFMTELAARAPHLRRYGMELRGTLTPSPELG